MALYGNSYDSIGQQDLAWSQMAQRAQEAEAARRMEMMRYMASLGQASAQSNNENIWRQINFAQQARQQRSIDSNRDFERQMAIKEMDLRNRTLGQNMDIAKMNADARAGEYGRDQAQRDFAAAANIIQTQASARKPVDPDRILLAFPSLQPQQKEAIKMMAESSNEILGQDFSQAGDAASLVNRAQQNQAMLDKMIAEKAQLEARNPGFLGKLWRAGRSIAQVPSWMGGDEFNAQDPNRMPAYQDWLAQAIARAQGKTETYSREAQGAMRAMGDMISIDPTTGQYRPSFSASVPQRPAQQAPRMPTLTPGQPVRILAPDGKIYTIKAEAFPKYQAMGATLAP